MIDVMAFGAHPDDLEFACGGILAKLAAERKSIVMVDLTLGEKGTNGTPEIRKQESLNAAKVIGAERVFLNFHDCEIYDTYLGRLELVKVIRHYQPKLLLAPTWKGEQTHPDHTATGSIARYAARYARFSKILPELPIHRVDGILHYLTSISDFPDFVVDISSFLETWKKMMSCHESQHITHNYSDWCLRFSSRLGLFIGTPYAQGLIKGNPIEIDDVMAIAKGTREI